MTMGTASTMTSAAEALGVTLPGAASIPAADSRARGDGDAHRAPDRRHGVGRRSALDAAHPHRLPQRGDDRARAGRLDQRDRAPDRDGPAASASPSPRRLRRAVAPYPLLANIRPAGKYLMEDFFYAGGLPALLARARRPARHDGAHRQRAHARREHRRTPRSSTTTSSVPGTTRWSRPTRWRSCTATSPRTAR